MRNLNTYRAVWRNIARAAGALRLTNAYLSANWQAHLLERAEQCKNAVEKCELAIAEHHFSIRERVESGRLALVAFWSDPFPTDGTGRRVIHRIIRELTNPKPGLIFAR